MSGWPNNRTIYDDFATPIPEDKPRREPTELEQVEYEIERLRRLQFNRRRYDDAL